MKGVIICDIPTPKQHNLKRFLEDFMLTNAKHYKVELTEGEYKSTHVAYESLRLAIKRQKHPIKVSTCNGVIYLTRTDI